MPKVHPKAPFRFTANPLRFASYATLMAASVMTACGDDGPSSPDTTQAGDTAGDISNIETMDAVEETQAGDSASDTAGPTPDTSDTPDTVDGIDTPDTAQPGDTTTPGDTTVTPSITASLTIDGTSSEVTPSVRRGFVYTQSVARQSFSTLNQPTQLSCEGTSGHVQGGRIINPTSVGISGGFGSNCDPGGSGANFRIGEEQMLFGVRQTCGGGVGSCAHDFTESFLLRFGQCDYDNVGFSVQYNCEALFPGPSFIVEVPSAFGLLRAEGLDGLGEMGCEQRVATFRLDGQALTPAEGVCKVTIDERGPSLLSGRIEVTLSLGGANRPVVIDFEHTETETRPLFAIFYQDDLCASSSLTTTVETIGDDVYDVITSGTLSCQANPQRTVAPLSVSLPRPREGGQGQVKFGQDTHIHPSYASLYEIDRSPTRVRLAAYELQLCSDANFQTCRDTMPIVYVQGPLTP